MENILNYDRRVFVQLNKPSDQNLLLSAALTYTIYSRGLATILVDWPKNPSVH